MCPDKILLSEYMDGELSEEGQKALKQHIDHCESCSGLIGKWTGQSQLLASLDSGVCDQTRVNIKNRIESKRAEKKVVPFWQKEVPWTYAAGLALVFTLGALLTGLGIGKPSQQAPLVDIHQWDDSSYFTLDSSSGSDPFEGSEDPMEIVIDVDASLSYMGESTLIHQASFDGGDTLP